MPATPSSRARARAAASTPADSQVNAAAPARRRAVRVAPVAAEPAEQAANGTVNLAANAAVPPDAQGAVPADLPDDAVAPAKSPRGRKKGFGPRHEDRRVQILSTAARLFATKGYEATSLDTIADQLGMHKATLYHYIRNKEEVLYQCLVKSFEDLDQVIETCKDTRLKAIERLRIFATALAHAENNEFGRCLVLVGARPLELGSSDIRAFQKRLDTMVRGLVEEGVARGELRPCNSGLVAAMFFGTLNWVPHWFSDRGKLSLDEIIDTFMDMMFNGLATRRARAAD